MRCLPVFLIKCLKEEFYPVNDRRRVLTSSPRVNIFDLKGNVVSDPTFPYRGKLVAL